MREEDSRDRDEKFAGDCHRGSWVVVAGVGW